MWERLLETAECFCLESCCLLAVCLYKSSAVSFTEGYLWSYVLLTFSNQKL